MRDRIRTDGFTVLQTVPLGLSGTLTQLVDRRRIELRLKACKAPVLPLSLPAQCLAVQGGLEPPTYGLTDRRIYRLSYWTIVLVESVGFEPTDPVS